MAGLVAGRSCKCFSRGWVTGCCCGADYAPGVTGTHLSLCMVSPDACGITHGIFVDACIDTPSRCTQLPRARQPAPRCGALHVPQP